MKRKLFPLSRQDVTALEKHLKRGPEASLLPALELGRQAVTLGLDTLDLARMHERAMVTRQLAVTQRGGVQRKLMENHSSERAKHRQKCLEESLELQRRLRHLTHRVVAAQEDEQKKISSEWQDEIAQTLLGINVRLLCLRQEARQKTDGSKNTIASAERLVANSARSLRRMGCKIGGL